MGKLRVWLGMGSDGWWQFRVEMQAIWVRWMVAVSWRVADLGVEAAAHGGYGFILGGGELGFFW